MKFTATFALLSLLFAAPAVAEQLKIGYVEVPRLLIECEVGKAAQEKLKKKISTEQEKLDGKLEDIREFQEDVQKRAMMLSEAEQKKASEENERQVRDARRLREDLQRDLKKYEQQVMNEVNEKLRKVISQYGEDQEYDLILDAGTLLFVSTDADLTDDLIKAADKAY